MNIKNLKIRAASLGTAAVLMLTLASPAMCEAKTNEINTHMYTITELFDALGDHDYYSKFERTNGRVTDVYEEADRFYDNYMNYLDIRYDDEIHEISRNDANAALFYLSKQVFSNLVADHFNVSIYDINLKKVDDHYEVIIRRSAGDLICNIYPTYLGENNPLYAFVQTMESSYNHKMYDTLENMQMLLAMEDIKSIMTTQMIVYDEATNSLGLAYDNEKVAEVNRYISGK